jgi:hypothetical protein
MFAFMAHPTGFKPVTSAFGGPISAPVFSSWFSLDQKLLEPFFLATDCRCLGRILVLYRWHPAPATKLKPAISMRWWALLVSRDHGKWLCDTPGLQVEDFCGRLKGAPSHKQFDCRVTTDRKVPVAISYTVPFVIKLQRLSLTISLQAPEQSS